MFPVPKGLALPGAWLLDLVIGALLAEWLLLALAHRLAGLGPAPTDLAAGMAAGLVLMLALRLNVGEQVDYLTLLLLAVSGLLHAIDLARRWPRKHVLRPEALSE